MLGGASEALRLGRPQHTRAAHRDGLEPLGAHDRAQPTAAGGARPVHHHARAAHAALTGRPDGRDAGLCSPGAAPQLSLRLPDVQAPQVICGPQFCAAIMDPQVHGTRRLARDHDRVEAGVLQLRGKVAARIGHADAAGQRVLGVDGQPAARRRQSPGERAGAEGHDVRRVERIRAGRHLSEEDPLADAAAAERVAQVVRGGLCLHRPGSQVYPQDPPCPECAGHAPAPFITV